MRIVDCKPTVGTRRCTVGTISTRAGMPVIVRALEGWFPRLPHKNVVSALRNWAAVPNARAPCNSSAFSAISASANGAAGRISMMGLSPPLRRPQRIQIRPCTGKQQEEQRAERANILATRFGPQLILKVRQHGLRSGQLEIAGRSAIDPSTEPHHLRHLVGLLQINSRGRQVPVRHAARVRVLNSVRYAGDDICGLQHARVKAVV